MPPLFLADNIITQVTVLFKVVVCGMQESAKVEMQEPVQLIQVWEAVKMMWDVFGILII
jgi:hypothetical protein